GPDQSELDGVDGRRGGDGVPGGAVPGGGVHGLRADRDGGGRDVQRHGAGGEHELQLAGAGDGRGGEAERVRERGEREAAGDENVDGYYLMASSDQGNRPAVGGAWPPGARITRGPTGLGLNTWTHLAATFDGATVRLYVNGAEAVSQAQTAALTPTAGTLQIG